MFAGVSYWGHQSRVLSAEIYLCTTNRVWAPSPNMQQSRKVVVFWVQILVADLIPQAIVQSKNGGGKTQRR